MKIKKTFDKLLFENDFTIVRSLVVFALSFYAGLCIQEASNPFIAICICIVAITGLYAIYMHGLDKYYMKKRIEKMRGK